MADFGIDLELLRSERRPVLRIDLDWTERRDHFAGSLPAALMFHLLDEQWIGRGRDERQLKVNEAGRTALAETFGIAH